MKKYLVRLFFLLAPLAASAQPLCVVWTGEPADKCDRQQQAKPPLSRSAQPASNPLGVEWGGKSTEQRSARPATTSPQAGSGWVGGGRTPDVPKPAAGNGLGVEWAGGNQAPAAPRPTGGNGLGVEWAGGNQAPAAPRPTGGNGLGVEWAGGNQTPAAPGPATGTGLGLEWAGGSKPPAPQSGSSTLDMDWAGGNRNVGAPSTGTQPAACNVAEFDQKLTKNSNDFEYVKQQVKYYTDTMINATRNGFTCTDCNARLIALASESGRIQREREQLLQLKNQCIAANNRAGQGSQSSPAPSAIAAACLPIQEKLEKYQRWYQDVAASWAKDCRNAAYYPPSCGAQYKVMQTYAEEVKKSEAELKACRQNS